MIRGTTPTIRLVFKYTLDFLSDYDITFSQEDGDGTIDISLNE